MAARHACDAQSHAVRPQVPDGGDRAHGGRSLPRDRVHDGEGQRRSASQPARPRGSSSRPSRLRGAPALSFTMVKDNAGAPRSLLGLEEDPRGFEPLYTQEEDKFPLLPRPLTGGVVYDSLGSTIVTDAGGVELYRSPVQYAPLFAARDSFEEPMMGRVQVQVALRPDLAPKLVIGGMPRSNVPMLLSLLALTAVLVVAALLQLRREYELSRLRADFVSGVSHELRTPLAQIRMFSETLLLGRVRSDEERERSLEIVDQEARRLTHLVENLLHFSRSERRLARLSLAPAPL